MSYLVRLSSHVRRKEGGPTVDGEYDGGDSLTSARKEARQFASYTTGGHIYIYKLKRGSDRVTYVETIR